MENTGQEGGPELKPNEVHYLIDEEFQRRLKDGNVISVKGDAAKTMLRANSIHEVHIHNLFSEAVQDDKIPDDIGLLQKIEEKNRLREERDSEVLKEAVRIARNDGSIFVGDTIAPEGCPKSEIVRLAKRHGLEAEFIVQDEGKHEEAIKTLEKYIGSIRPSALENNEGYYLAKLTKKQP